MEGQFMIGFLGFPEVSEVQTLLSKPIETTFLESEKKNCYFHMTKVKLSIVSTVRFTIQPIRTKNICPIENLQILVL